LVGNITSEDRTEIASDGRVVGDILTPKLVISDGATIRGRIDMPNFDAPAVEVPNFAAESRHSIGSDVSRTTGEDAARVTASGDTGVSTLSQGLPLIAPPPAPPSLPGMAPPPPEPLPKHEAYGAGEMIDSESWDEPKP